VFLSKLNDDDDDDYENINSQFPNFIR